jgi:hypothetical protein
MIAVTSPPGDVTRKEISCHDMAEAWSPDLPVNLKLSIRLLLFYYE